MMCVVTVVTVPDDEIVPAEDMAHKANVRMVILGLHHWSSSLSQLGWSLHEPQWVLTRAGQIHLDRHFLLELWWGNFSLQPLHVPQPD
jgi:hypothetical protein